MERRLRDEIATERGILGGLASLLDIVDEHDAAASLRALMPEALPPPVVEPPAPVAAPIAPPSPKATPLTRAQRQRVIERDGGRCRRCGFNDRAGLDVHHLRDRALGGSNAPRNLITLCGACHHEWTIHASSVMSWGDWFSVPGVALAMVAAILAAPASVTVGEIRDGWAKRRAEIDGAARVTRRVTRRRRTR